METLTFIKDIVAILLITAGLILFIIEIYGVFRFDFVLNRMHAAAIGDTLALSCTLLLMVWIYILAGAFAASAKAM